MKFPRPFLFLLFLLTPLSGRAELSVPNFFSDHLVLQRERNAAIWGTANPGAEVTVSFKKEQVTVKADEKGKWRAEISTGAADATGSPLTIESGGEKKTIADVLVGEVWFASGQSNMYFTMDRVPAYVPLIADTHLPALRFFNAPLVTAVEAQENIDGAWTSASPETVPGYSAVAFFFARKLHLELGIPVGVIKSAWGGKPVETFTSREALLTLPGTRSMVEATLSADAAYVPEKAKASFETRLAQWEAANAAARKLPAEDRKKLPKKPTAPKRPLDTEGQPGVLYNSMINPFAGYTMRGAIWYQGEGNARAGAVPYDQTLPLLIRDWRERWGDEFSFYYVQLANYRAPSTEPGTPDPWALLQDRMRLVLDTTPKTGMAIINDVGEANDIHPKDKETPGDRLARLALAKDYGKDIVFSGPLYRSSEPTGKSITVHFDQAGSGLKSRDGGPLKRFEIAGKDKVWHWADAVIEGSEKVVVSSDAVPEPVAVRYAWASNPEGANLVNSEGLPASVFRTDDWDDVDGTVPVAASPQLDERRALAVEIKAMNAKRQTLDRKSPAYQELSREFQAKMKRFQETASAPN
jgi:sialate O-acetylesterase